PDAVLDGLEQTTRERNRMAVREMPAVSQAHAEQRVAGGRHREIGGEVRRRTRMGLHIGVARAEQTTDSLERQILRHVDELAPAVIALAWQALGVLVGH